METAIPENLLAERTRPRRMREGYAPPYPSFVARNRPEVQQVVMAYLGLQFHGEQPPLDVLDDALATADGPRHHDRARHTLPDGTAEIVSITYWDDPATFDRWYAAHRDSWLGDAARDGAGRWVEILRPTVADHETLFSGEVQEHAYWGGMRDRIPLAQTDPLAPTGAPVVERDRGRVRIRPHGGICLIRANRYLTVLEDGRPVDRTFGLSWWHSLDALERWAESHQTHLEIFGAAMRYLSSLGPAARLRLYHEVSVVPEGAAFFEYVDCRPGTGVLRALAG
jgi:aldoxime dehydratase